MNTKTFFRWLEMHKIKADILSDDKRDTAVDKLLAAAGGDRLHYLWENEGSSKYITRYKIGDERDEYLETIDALINDGTYTLVIDDVCFSDTEEPVAIELEKDSLLEVLGDFYLYLDEIYICKNNVKWIICINHRFWVYLYGEESDGECTDIYNKIRDIADEEEYSDNEDGDEEDDEDGGEDDESGESDE